MKLSLEINAKAIQEPQRALEPLGILITPPIDEDFWLLRVAVSETQAIVGFPKFGILIGIGFQHEEDWNTNLPSSCEAEKIYRHIRVNKGDARIPARRCVEAIRLIQGAVAVLKTQAPRSRS